MIHFVTIFELSQLKCVGCRAIFCSILTEESASYFILCNMRSHKKLFILLMNKESRHNILYIYVNPFNTMECVRQSVVSVIPERKKKQNKYLSSVLLYIMHIRLIDCLQTSSDASHYTTDAHMFAHTGTAIYSPYSTHY